MRKALLIAAAVATSLVTAGPATASHGRATAPARDSVFGAGTLPDHPSFGFSVNAVSGPLGEDPDGHLMIRSLGWVRHADVTCMAVTGAHAQISGPVTSQNFEGDFGGEFFPHQTAALIIVDDMPPPLRDRVTFITFREDLGVDPNTACLDPATASDPFHGNVTVRDG